MVCGGASGTSLIDCPYLADFVNFNARRVVRLEAFAVYTKMGWQRNICKGHFPILNVG